MDNSRTDKPRIAITMGDAAGIGPETIVAAWSSPLLHSLCTPYVCGHPEVLDRAAALLNAGISVVEIDSLDQAQPGPGLIPCFKTCQDDVIDVPPGTVDSRTGQAAYDSLLAAAEKAQTGEVDAITTAPLSKAALWKAGHRYPGHTELLAELCGVDEVGMMLYLGPEMGVEGPAGLGVVHVTLHQALRSVFADLTVPHIVAKAHLADSVFRKLMDGTPRIGICALNPHAGESGLFGHEESTIIAPAVEKARQEGLCVEGPLPADTLLLKARHGQFDAIVAMYHDQGHIALKLLGMHRAVNITLGLPIVRTSVAHGTAFDIAWKGQAESSGMIEALRVASKLARARQTASP